MITARRAALLGLTTPLSAIMIALLGLWPEQDDPPTPPIPPAFVEVGGGMTAARAAEVRRQNAQEDDDAPRVARQNSLIVALVTAAITEGLM